MSENRLLEEFERLGGQLSRLVDDDPRAAIETARKILATTDILDKANRMALAGIVLTDAGSDCKDSNAVAQGVSIFEDLHRRSKSNPYIDYNLANALITRANLVVVPSIADWCVVTSLDRIRAKELYLSAAHHPESGSDLRARALNNLGNALAKNWRLIEAYDCYARAIEHEPTNGVALSYAAKALVELEKYGLAMEEDVAPTVASLVRKANACVGGIAQIVGRTGDATIREFLEASNHVGDKPPLTDASKYQRFVATNRLALTPSIDGLDLNLSQWDSLRLGPILVQSPQAGVPTIFTMFNLLKSDFLAARFAAYLALEEQCPESGKYYDTLDYARYGTSMSMMAIAQKCCFDLLDKTAVAIHSYLGLPGKADETGFGTLWFLREESNENRQPRAFTPSVCALIEQGNFLLIAITEVARDLRGYLKAKKSIRHAATHRFTVLHDEAFTVGIPSKQIEHFSLAEYQSQLIESLQMVRSVLFYFVHLVTTHERKKERSGRIGIIEIPDHDFIRGAS